jgi:hypothetical protein
MALDLLGRDESTVVTGQKRSRSARESEGESEEDEEERERERERQQEIERESYRDQYDPYGAVHEGVQSLMSLSHSNTLLGGGGSASVGQYFLAEHLSIHDLDQMLSLPLRTQQRERGIAVTEIETERDRDSGSFIILPGKIH